MPPGNKYLNKHQSLGDLLKTFGKPIMDHDYTEQSDYNNLLEDTQANILKSHNKPSLKYFFLSFKEEEENARENARALLSKLGNVITSAKTQLQQIQSNGQSSDTKPFLNVYLTYAGYKFLGISANLIPEELKIAGGKLQERINLRTQNPFIAEEDVHAIILYGDGENNDFPEYVPELKNHIVGAMPCQRENPSEHYKFKDGISNPCFFPKPGAFLTSLDQVLLHDKASNTSFGCGSYGVLMKFQMNDDALDELSAKFEGDRDKAFANVMGRFKNGAPIAHYETAPDNPDYTPENRFDYQDDLRGSKCPFHTHARKSYPRTRDSVGRSARFDVHVFPEKPYWPIRVHHGKLDTERKRTRGGSRHREKHHQEIKAGYAILWSRRPVPDSRQME